MNEGNERNGGEDGRRERLALGVRNAARAAGAGARSGARRLHLGAAARWFGERRAARQWTINLAGMLLLIQAGRIAAGWIQPVLTPADLFLSPLIGPEAVEVTEARPGRVERVVTYTGSAQPWEDNTVYARVDGYVEALNVYPGDRVRRGQLLTTLETSNLEPRLEEARVDSTFWAAELRRDSLLYEEDVISAAEYDRTRNGYGTSAAKVALLRTQIDYTRIRALTGGWIAERHVYPGQYVRAGAPVVRVDQLDRVRIQFEVPEESLSRIRPGTPVFLRFPQLDQRAVLAAWPDRAGPAPGSEGIADGAGPEAAGDGAPGALGGGPPAGADSSPASGEDGAGAGGVPAAARPKPSAAAPQTGHRTAEHAASVRGEVAVVFPAQDPATRTGIVEVRLLNPGLLRTNTYIVGDFVVEEGEGVRVPVSALTAMPGGRTVVFVVPPLEQETAVEEREVTVGVRGGRWAEVLSGVEPGELVVHSGNRSLTDGQGVYVLNARAGG